MAEFEGKSVVVTGGAKGIGRGVCEAFAVRGGAVLCLDVDEEAGEDLARRFERIVFRRADVSGMSPEEEARAWDAMARAHPLGRIGHPADIAKLVLFLASDGASFMTGDDIDCDGGLMAQGAWA